MLRPRIHLSLLILACSAFLAACGGPQATVGLIDIEVREDGTSRGYQVQAGSTVQQALTAAGVDLGPLDRTEPPSYTVVTDETLVEITRVSERFEIEEITVPFERQTVRNEALPEGETRLLQPGLNGVQEVTYRIVVEDGEEVSRTPVSRNIIEPPQAEIIMVGSQSSYAPVPISGRMAYLAAGNAWLLEGSTGNRTPLALSGDLDGRIFDLSADGSWLLFSRSTGEDSDGINSLWAVPIDSEATEPLDLNVANVVHFAAWSPSAEAPTLAYSTVEPSPAAPGWQANNDLHLLSLSGEGEVLSQEVLVEANAGGQYGWWGTDFTWAPDGSRLAFARADSIGRISLQEPSLEPLLELIPFQTLSDWAWVPGVTWGRDGSTLYFVDHADPIGLEEPTASPVFDLVAYNPAAATRLPLVERAGMFAAPAASPALAGADGVNAFRVAYLQAVEPLQSQNSSYRVGVMDRDGSNRELLFPEPEQVGLRGDDLQQPPVWSPDSSRLAVIYRGDLWLYDVETGRSQRVTGDGSTLAVDWH